MSDFFSNLRGSINGPDVVMNQGPLPPMNTAGMSNGFDGTPDAKIDLASSLLGGVQPYSYGAPNRLSTQTAYLNIPHIVSRIIPEILIPEPNVDGSGGFMRLNHQVDDGDIAFVVRAMFSPFEMVADKKGFNRKGMLHAIDPIVNLATVNYLLHGLQRYGYKDQPNDNEGKFQNWRTLWTALGLDEYLQTEKQGLNAANVDYNCMAGFRRKIAKHVIAHCITPFGVPRGSEKQGGQHQGLAYKSVTFPVDFVTSMVIDGKCSNLVNFWRLFDISAGDDLILFLEDAPCTEYVLSHHPKSTRKYQFASIPKMDRNAAMVNDDLDDLGDYAMEGAGIKRKLPNLSAPGERTKEFLLHAGGYSGSKEKESYARKYPSPPKKEYSTKFSKSHLTYSGSSKQIAREGVVTEPIFQLVPGTTGVNYHISSHEEGVMGAVWAHGYWHIARSQTMQQKCNLTVPIHSGAQYVTSGRPLEVTFSPVWMDPLSVPETGVFRTEDMVEEESTSQDSDFSTLPTHNLWEGHSIPDQGHTPRQQPQTFPPRTTPTTPPPEKTSVWPSQVAPVVAPVVLAENAQEKVQLGASINPKENKSSNQAPSPSTKKKSTTKSKATQQAPERQMTQEKPETQSLFEKVTAKMME